MQKLFRPADLLLIYSRPCGGADAIRVSLVGLSCRGLWTGSSSSWDGQTNDPPAAAEAVTVVGGAPEKLHSFQLCHSQCSEARPGQQQQNCSYCTESVEGAFIFIRVQCMLNTIHVSLILATVISILLITNYNIQSYSSSAATHYSKSYSRIGFSLLVDHVDMPIQVTALI